MKIKFLGNEAIQKRLLTFNAPHSGINDPPRFGDFQAHRHWMYLTQTPIEQWYTHNKDHVYQNVTAPQWVLDYPPITAYAHMIYGTTLPVIHNEHGNQDSLLIVRMRLFIFIIDLFLIYLMSKVRVFGNSTKPAFLVALSHPILLLIDYVHYQPNNLMFFFLSLSIFCYAKSHQNVNYATLGTMAFIFCIGSKQMALMYAPVMGLAYLGLVFQQPSTFKKLTTFAKLSLSAALAIACCIIPFIANYEDYSTGIKEQSIAIIGRIFPIHRGLFEDKVANFWCISDVVFKWRKQFDEPTLAKMCTTLCIGLTLPIAIKMLKKSSISDLFLSTSISGLIGFLFGYHIHEKTIMLPVFSILIYLALHNKPLDTSHFILYKYLTVCAFNIFPLVVLDNAILYFIALHLIWYNKPQLDIIYYRKWIHLIYHPVIYSFLALLQAYPLIVVERLPYLFNLLLYTWCFVGNCFALVTLLGIYYRVNPF